MVRPDQTTVVLDAGAVIGLARGNIRLRALIADAQQRGDDVVVPVVVIAETVRGNGPRDATINLTVGQFAPHRPLEESTARLAGALLGAAGSNATVDAIIAAEAIQRRPSALLTGDPVDLALLLDGHAGVELERI